MDIIAIWAQNNCVPKRRHIGNVWCALITIIICLKSNNYCWFLTGTLFG
jgi:hypothetical protein